MNDQDSSRNSAGAASQSGGGPNIRPPDDDEEYALSQPVERPQAPVAPLPPARPTPPPRPVSRDWAEPPKRPGAAEDLPPPPRWPMLSGIFTFPFYLNTLETLTFITVGLMATGWLLMFWIAYGAVGGGTTARLLGLPPCAAGLLTLGYTASCCLSIIENTSYGWDSIDIQSGLEWKEWVWSFAHLAALGLQACMIGGLVQWLSGAGSSTPFLLVTFVVFPFVLLGALAADGAWAPLAIVSVLRNLPRVWGAWVLFYLETAPLAMVWTALTVDGLRGPSPWLTPLYSAPLLAFTILIYARLVGRLAGCMTAATATNNGANDD